MSRFDYEEMVQKALRQVVSDALNTVAKDGFTGAHHFYITFQTDRSDVEMPGFLREKHPEEITIVLQHQFWDLEVTEKGFSVSLSFNDKHERIAVPFSAIISFLDPSVKFGLQFVPDEEEGADTSHDPTPPAPGAPQGPDATKTSGENVITMDRFRKKT